MKATRILLVFLAILVVCASIPLLRLQTRLLMEHASEKFSSLEENARVVRKTTPVEIYDKFYAKIYNSLIDEYKKKLVVYQCEDIEENTELREYKDKATILDVGCGTGGHLSELGKSYHITGLDISADMLSIARDRIKGNPRIRLMQNDMMNEKAFRAHQFSHIICFYFSFYYGGNPSKLIDNCHRWLKTGGYLVLELVDRDNFDPMLEAANPFPLLSVQNYSKERVTKSTIYFNNMLYESDFKLLENSKAIFKEHLTMKDTERVIINVHRLTMPNYEEITKMVKKKGFRLQKVTNLGKVNYNYHYIMYFKKL
jgi:SAM-dependent methyltransferase